MPNRFKVEVGFLCQDRCPANSMICRFQKLEYNGYYKWAIVLNLTLSM